MAKAAIKILAKMHGDRKKDLGSRFWARRKLEFTGGNSSFHSRPKRLPRSSEQRRLCWKGPGERIQHALARKPALIAEEPDDAVAIGIGELNLVVICCRG